MVLVRKNTLLIAKPPESGLGGLLDDSKSPPSSRMPKQTRPSAWLSSLTCNLTALTSGGGSGGGVGGGDGGGGSLGGGGGMVIPPHVGMLPLRSGSSSSRGSSLVDRARPLLRSRRRIIIFSAKLL